MMDRAKFSRARLRQEVEGQPVNPKRITMALDFRSLYGPEVDEACGGREPMVDEWEAGRLAPTPEQLARLAELTGFTPEWFRKPDPEPITQAIICWGDKRGCEVIGEQAHPSDPLAEVIPLRRGTLW